MQSEIRSRKEDQYIPTRPFIMEDVRTITALQDQIQGYQYPVQVQLNYLQCVCKVAEALVQGDISER